MDAYSYIKNAIIEGIYEPGKRLTEEALAKELNISRTPIREAIQQLLADGFIVQLKRGVAVREFTKVDIRQIYDLRAVLESYAASEAAFRRTETDLIKMKEANEAYRKAVEEFIQSKSNNLDFITETNRQFHDAILDAAQNDYLRFHLEKVIVLPLVFQSFYWYTEQELLRSYDIHNYIYHAIKHQEFERAKTAMREHVYLARDHVLKHSDKINNKLSKGGGKSDSNL